LTARLTALNSLLDTKDPGLPPILQGLLKTLVRATRRFGAWPPYDDPNTPAAILAVYNSLEGAEKGDALNTLASRAAFARPMVAAINDGRIPRAALTAEIIPNCGI